MLCDDYYCGHNVAIWLIDQFEISRTCAILLYLEGYMMSFLSNSKLQRMETNDNVVDFVWGIMMPNYIQDICVFIKVEEASYLHQDPYLRKKVYDYCT